MLPARQGAGIAVARLARQGAGIAEHPRPGGGVLDEVVRRRIAWRSPELLLLLPVIKELLPAWLHVLISRVLLSG
jgi:hypothetical protein